MTELHPQVQELAVEAYRLEASGGEPRDDYWEPRSAHLRAMNKAIEAVVQLQLPHGMEHCVIEFIECPEGHGRLIAKNWIDPGCQTCEIEALKKEFDGGN